MATRVSFGGKSCLNLKDVFKETRGAAVVAVGIAAFRLMMLKKKRVRPSRAKTVESQKEGIAGG